MKLYLIRHGETIENARKIVMGHLPGRLSRDGKIRAKKLALFLKNHHFDAIYSSDLKRAADTVKEIAKYHPGQIIYNPLLRESHFGNLQGKSWQRAQTIFSKLPGRLITKKARGGESLTDLRRRVGAFIRHLLVKHKNDTVLIVTHNGVIKVFLSIFQKIPLSKIISSPAIANAASSIIIDTGGSIVNISKTGKVKIEELKTT